MYPVHTANMSLAQRDGQGHWNLFAENGFNRRLSQALQEKQCLDIADNITKPMHIKSLGFQFFTGAKKQEAFRALAESLLILSRIRFDFRPQLNQSVGNCHKQPVG